MTYEQYRYLFIFSAVACGLMLVASVLLFIRFNVPKLLGDISGRTAKRAIKTIREQNFHTGEISPRAVNLQAGKVTDDISQLSPMERGRQVSSGRTAQEEWTAAPGTETEVLYQAENTALLYEYSGAPAETAVLEPVPAAGGVTVRDEATFIHTDEVIE